MIDPYKSHAITNLKKAQGQITYILKMIERDEYCIKVAGQVNAAIGLLKKTNSYTLESHLHTCAGRKLTQKNTQAKKKFITELIRAFSVTNR